MSYCDEDTSVVNGTLDLEILIDRPIAQVWKQHLDVGSWVTSHTIEHAHGTPGTVGAINRVSYQGAAELGMPGPHYHYCKIIKLIPEQQYVIKTFSERGGSYGLQLLGFDDTRFIAVGDQTRVSFRWFGEYRGEWVTNNPTALKSTEEDSHMLKNLQNLKRIVESR